jgi:hypothetical protein
MNAMSAGFDAVIDALGGARGEAARARFLMLDGRTIRWPALAVTDADADHAAPAGKALAVTSAAATAPFAPASRTA